MRSFFRRTSSRDYFPKRFILKKEARITGLQDDIGAWANVYLCAT
jgi:hypothetical protein